MRSGTKLKAATVGAFALAIVALSAPAGAAANTITVTTTADEAAVANGQCALREAIIAANNDTPNPTTGCSPASGNDTIVVPAGTFKLAIAGAGEDFAATGDLDVNEFATISHEGTKPAIIDGNGLDRVFNTSSTGLTRLVGLTITGGLSPQNGGGIFNDGALALDRVTLTKNQGQFGGGLSTSAATTTITNSTFSGNTATSSGGGISAGTIGNATTITSSTIVGNTAGNDGGGILGGVGNTSMRSVLIAGNSDNPAGLEGPAPDCFRQAGFFQSSGSVLVGNPTGCDYTAGPGDVVNTIAQTGPLAFNGGPTQTHVLFKSSPAINKGSGCPGFDQRGVPRKACDIGAYERLVIKKVLVNFVGTPVADKLVGTKGRDAMLGLLGKDKLVGGKKNDVLVGGKGNDLLIGGKGNDVCNGGAGKDKFKGCEVEK
jgi:CSLREA domain-containing protein